jgi:hypothetical protein
VRKPRRRRPRQRLALSRAALSGKTVQRKCSAGAVPLGAGSWRVRADGVQHAAWPVTSERVPKCFAATVKERGRVAMCLRGAAVSTWLASFLAPTLASARLCRQLATSVAPSHFGCLRTISQLFLHSLQRFVGNEPTCPLNYVAEFSANLCHRSLSPKTTYRYPHNVAARLEY